MRTTTSLALLLTSNLVLAATGSAPETVNPVQRQCTGCHLPEPGGALSRISHQRKTPEGWEMTISRMQLIHKLKISNTDTTGSNASKRELVKYLADHQGLAPAETEDYRYLIEQRPNVVEDFDENLAQMCGRCHSSARFALQRRAEPEWEMLVHYHLGQYPSTEYSLFGRDRDWFRLALEEVVPELAERYPLDTKAWQDWQAAEKPRLDGRWLARGYMPGKGQFIGQLEAEAGDPDSFSVSLTGKYESGDTINVSGSAVVYTGYEWRASLSSEDQSWRQVLAASTDSSSLSGRQFPLGQPELGMDLELIRDDGSAQLVSVSPARIRAGETEQISLHGANLKGELKMPEGLRLVSVDARDDDQWTVTVTADADASAGQRAITLGEASLPDALAVYRQLNALEVSPGYAIARIGGNGGPLDKVPALFRARGIDFGSDGAPGGGDDVTVELEQANWRVEPYSEQAAKDRDVKYSGQMAPGMGLFTPAAAGPNPERHMGTNNAGDLRVIAQWEEDGRTLQGESHLIVTVQRWNNPPLK